MSILMRWLIRIAATLGLLLIVVSITPLLRWWTDALAADWGREEGDVLIVLSGEAAGNNIIGLSSYWRSYYAVLKWREHRYSSVIVTGKDAAQPMRDFMTSQGLPPQSIQVENAATTTRQSAVNVASMLAGTPERVVLLTSDFHSGRALRAFRKAGLNASSIPVPDARKRANDPVQCWALFVELAEETAKVAYYKTRGWL